MALVKTEQYNVPNEPGKWFSIRRLSYSQMREAQDAGSKRAYQELADMPERVFDQAMKDQTPEKAEQAREKRAPEDAYDWDTVLRLAVQAWNYDEECTHENIKLLDEPTARWAVRTALGLETEDEAGKGISPLS